MDIICHAFTPWEGNYVKSTVELMRRLAQRHRVLYVDYAYTWKDFFQSLLGARGHGDWKAMLGLTPRLTRHNTGGEGLYRLTLPPTLPVNALPPSRLYDYLNRLNALGAKRSIRRAMKKLNMPNPVVVNALNPGMGRHLVGQLNAQKTIYYCYDEISAAHWLKNHGRKHESLFLGQADAVVVSSDGLFQAKSPFNPHTFTVKNGVDYALFAAPSQKPVRSNPFGKPVIGYIGTVDDRLDTDLLTTLIGHFPDAVFQFVGRVLHEPLRAATAAFPNVQFIGAVTAQEVPAYLQNMDVCLIPFVKNAFTQAVYPLKINEYLAAGKPVVTTRFADLADFSDVVAVADDPSAFVQAVARAIRETDEHLVQQRKALAKQNDWTARAAELERILTGGF